MKEFFDNLIYEIDWRKVAIFGPILLIIFGLAGWYGYSTLNAEEENLVEETIPLSQEENAAILTSATGFINSVGNFGFNYKLAVDSNSILEAKKLAQSNPNDESMFFTSRATSYLAARDNIARDSPIYYPTTQALTWSNDVEIGNLERLFEVSDVSFEIPETVSKIDFKGAQYDLVTLEVTLDSNVSYAKQRATDASWDGTVDIYSKAFNQEEFDLKLIKIGDNWEAYDINDLNNAFLLSTWVSPELNYYYSDLNDGFEVSESFKVNLPNIAPGAPAPAPAPSGNDDSGAPTPEISPAPIDPNVDPSVAGNIPAPGPES